NCIRGEDSLVRALWAGKPLLWHIYPQDDQAHIAKLDAWLASSPYPSYIADLMRSWNHHNAAALGQQLQHAFAPANWTTWQNASKIWCHQLAQQPELAHALVAFCQQFKK